MDVTWHTRLCQRIQALDKILAVLAHKSHDWTVLQEVLAKLCTFHEHCSALDRSLSLALVNPPCPEYSLCDPATLFHLHWCLVFVANRNIVKNTTRDEEHAVSNLPTAKGHIATSELQRRNARVADTVHDCIVVLLDVPKKRVIAKNLRHELLLEFRTQMSRELRQKHNI